MDDLELVRLCLKNDDRDAFRMLVERYQDRVLRLVASILGPHADLDSEEVAQDVFLRVHRKLNQFRAEAQFSSWLYRIAYNAALDHRRTARLKLPHVDMDALRHAHAQANPLDELSDAQRHAMIVSAAEQLPDLYRTVLNLYYWLGCSVEEIGLYIGAPAGTVKSYLSRARDRMRLELKKKGIENV